MAIKRVFKKLADLFHTGAAQNRFNSKKPFPPWRTEPSRPHSRSQKGFGTIASAQQRFDAQVTSLADAKKKILAGSLELIGLNEIKAGLGDQWPLFAERIVAFAEQEIQRSLDPLDSYRRHGDLNFLVHFGHLDKAAAQKKAKQTTDRIQTALVSKVPAIAGVVRVRPFVGEIDASTLETSSTLSDALFARLVQMRVEVVDDLKARRTSLTGSLRVLFSPVSRTGRGPTILNRCIVDREYYRDLSLRLHELDDEAENGNVTAEIDYLTLTKSLEGLHQLRMAGGIAVILIPFELSTIQSPSSREEYLRLLKTIPESYRKFVVLETHGIHHQENSDECIRQLAVVRPFVKSIIVTLAVDDKRVTQFAEADVWAISVSLAGRATLDRQLVLELMQFISLCQDKETLLINANTLGLVRAATESGVTYVEGTAVSLPTREPRQSQRVHFSSIR